MKRKISSKQSGFTLIEIMLVVAVTALLGTIALPNFLRAHERAQAAVIIEEMRVVAAAIDAYAIEQHKGATDPVAFADIVPYLKPGSRLATSGGTDIMGGTITIPAIGMQPKIDAATKAKFNPNVIPPSFWGGY